MGSGNIKVLAFVPLDSRPPSYTPDGCDNWGAENDGGRGRVQRNEANRLWGIYTSTAKGSELVNINKNDGIGLSSYEKPPHDKSSYEKIRQFLYRILPGVCITCGYHSHRSIDLCRACEADLPWLHHACRRCGLPLGASDEVCLACAARPMPVEQTIAAFSYTFPVNHLIQQFKNHQDLASGKVLAKLLGQHIMRVDPGFFLNTAQPDGQTLLVPAPLHPKKQRSRGFNQSKQIATILAEIFKVKVDDQHLIRTQFTADQKLLSVAGRKKNVAHAFSMRRAFKGEKIILVDDVVTTGATVAAMAHCLLGGGAASVAVVALARTPPRHDLPLG